MKKINFKCAFNNITAEILNDLKKYSRCEGIINPLIVLPDIHYKRGEMSPTGTVMVSKNKIFPGFTHLSLGSGISLWAIEADKSFENKIKNCMEIFFKTLQKKNDQKVKLNIKEINQTFLDGANIFKKKGFLSNKEISNIENDGNFRKNYKNLLHPKIAIPEYLYKECLKNWGYLGHGNAFAELHSLGKINNIELYKEKKFEKYNFYLIIHSSLPGTFLTHYFTPRWGLHGKKFLPFEKEKWDYFSNHLKSKESIIHKNNYFPPSSKYFSIPYNSYDGNLYMSAQLSLINANIANRINQGLNFKKILSKNIKNVKMNLISDTVHDSIQKINVKKNYIIHRHGASPSIYKGKNQKDNSNLVIIPSAAGRPVSICKSDIGSKYTWNSCSHGTGRIYDRPKLKLKRFKSKPIDEIIKNGNKILYNKIDLNTEHPKAFKKASNVIKILEKEKIIKKIFDTKSLFVLKG